MGRLLSAQESGLLLVIGVIMACLTVYGMYNPKPARSLYEPPAGAVVTELPGGDVLVVADGRERVYPAEQGWELRGDRLMRMHEVNRFLEKDNLILVTNKASFIAVMAVGMTMIIVLGGIDLSVGSLYAMSAMLGAMVLKWALPEDAGVLSAVLVAVAACCAVGGLGGLVNGLMIVGFRVHPFIITLGTMAIFRGVVFVASRGQTVSGFPESVQVGFFKAELWGVYPVPTVLMIVVAVFGMVVLSRTVFGRRVYAIGGNETAARYAGIPVGSVKLWVYLLAGVLAGLSGCMYVGYFGAAESNAGLSYELKVIAAAVIGGASLSGGRGSAVGAVLGAILVELIDNAMLIFELDQSYNQIVMGAAIVIAVVIDQFKSRVVSR